MHRILSFILPSSSSVLQSEPNRSKAAPERMIYSLFIKLTSIMDPMDLYAKPPLNG